MRTLIAISSLAITLPTIIMTTQVLRCSNTVAKNFSPARHEQALAFFLLFASFISIVGYLCNINSVNNIGLYRWYTLVEWLFWNFLFIHYTSHKRLEFYLAAIFIPLIIYTFDIPESVYTKIECFFLMVTSVLTLIYTVRMNIGKIINYRFWIVLSVLIYSLNYLTLSEVYTTQIISVFSSLNIVSIILLTIGTGRIWVAKL